MKSKEDITDSVIDEVLAELREEDKIEQEIQEEIEKEQKRKQRKRGIIIISVVLILVASFLIIYLQTYTSDRLIVTYDTGDTGNNNYQQFGDGVIKYSKDGISLIDRKGVEKWNQAYQIKNPILNTYGDQSIVVANKSGNNMIVMNQNGWKGEIKTTLPIMKVAISGQGIVAAILDDSTSPRIVCYDVAGNVLVELKTSLNGTGYPLDIALSENGKVLMVSALSVKDHKVETKVKYFNFDGEKSTQKEFEVTSDSYEDMVGATGFFVNQTSSVVVGDNQLLLYRGDKTPKLYKALPIKKKIKNVFYNDKYIGLVLKNTGKEGYEVCLYNLDGRKVLSEEFVGEYSNAKVIDGQVLLYDGKKCNVYTKSGIHRFEGELSEEVLEIFPVVGVNKYIVMNTSGMQVVRFVK